MVYFKFKCSDDAGHIVYSNIKSTDSLTYITLEDFVIGTTDWATLTENSLCTLELLCKGHFAVGRVSARQKSSTASDHFVVDEKYELEIEHNDADYISRKTWSFFKGYDNFEASIDAKTFT